MKRLIAIRKRGLAVYVFIVLTALGFALYKIGWDYLRSPHSEIVDFRIKPAPQNQEGI